MHDSVGLHLGTSLQSAKLQVTTSKFTAKLLLLSHSENYIKLNFVVVSHKIFWPGCFAPPYLLRPGATAPLCPPSVTPLWSPHAVVNIIITQLAHR